MAVPCLLRVLALLCLASPLAAQQLSSTLHAQPAPWWTPTQAVVLRLTLTNLDGEPRRYAIDLVDFDRTAGLVSALTPRDDSAVGLVQRFAYGFLPTVGVPATTATPLVLLALALLFAARTPRPRHKDSLS